MPLYNFINAIYKNPMKSRNSILQVWWMQTLSNMTMLINHCKKNSIITKNIKVIIDKHFENKTPKVKVWRFISTHQQPLVAMKNIMLHNLWVLWFCEWIFLLKFLKYHLPFFEFFECIYGIHSKSERKAKMQSRNYLRK